MALIDDILRQHDTMKTQRNTELDNHARQCFKYSFPQLGTKFAGDLSAEAANQERAELMDSTLTDAARTLSSSLISGLVPANSQWLELRETGREATDGDVTSSSQWLSKVSKAVWQAIHASNFDSEAFDSMLVYVICGQFALFHDFDRVRGGFRFEQLPISECYFASANGLSVDTLSREYQLTAAQAVAEFGEENVGTAIREAMDTDPNKKFNFIWFVGPRRNRRADSPTNKNMPFMSVHATRDDKRIVRESGFHEFPVMVPRYIKIPGTPYARGPVSDALPDAKELNELKRLEKQNAEMAVAGTYVAADDGVINTKNIVIGPRKIVTAADVKNIVPLAQAGNFQVAFTMEDGLKQQIRRVMMADQLGAVGENGQMTATEVNERMNLIRQQMGPAFGRMQTEFLKPLVERCFWTMLRNGALPDVPDSMRDVEFHVVFDNPLARAQRLTEVTAIQQSLALLGQVVQIDPTFVDNYDIDAMLRDAAEALGVPAAQLRTVDDVATLRQQRAQAMQQQQQDQMNAQLQMQNASEQITQANTPQGAAQ